MSFSREELIEKAGATVTRMLNELATARVVPRFVDQYAREADRRGLRASPLRYRELQQTLTREALVAMSAKVEAELPRRLTGRKGALLRGNEAEAAEAFREEFYARLAQAVGWTTSEAEEFRRDVALCAQMAARLSANAAARGSLRSRRAEVGGPFVDRCALLLDPSMLEKARQAAAQFLAGLDQSAEKILAVVFRRKN
jgi:hypothetical protein